MIIDSSAVVAIFLKEPGYEHLHSQIPSAEVSAIGAPTVVEAVIALSARAGRDARPDVVDFLREAGVEIISFSEQHFHIAVSAFLRYGKGRRRATLNFRACLTNAITYVAGMPLLFTGDDFTATDLQHA